MLSRPLSLCPSVGTLSLIAVGFLGSGCQKSEPTIDEVVVDEPVVDVDFPAETASEQSDQIDAYDQTASLGSDPNCAIPVIAKSLDAVGDPCMTTTRFIDTLAVLTKSQQQRAQTLVAQSDQLLAPETARLAH